MNANGLLLVLIVSVAAVHGTFFIKSGQEYEYESTVTMSAGVTDYAPHSSGNQYKMNVRMQANGKNVNFEVSDIRISQYIGPIDTQGPSVYEMNKFTTLGYPPVTFGVTLDDDGKFSSLSYPSGLPLHQMNLIRGWASQMQINAGEINRGSFAFKSHEKTVFGECDVSYTVTGSKVFKSVSHNTDCVKMPSRIADHWGGYRCDADHHHHDPHLDHHEHHQIKTDSVDGLVSQSMTTYDLEQIDGGYQVTKMETIGSLIFHMFSNEGVAHISWFSHKSVLLSQKASSNDINPGDQTTDTLEYQFDDAQYKWDLNRNLKARENFFFSGDFYEGDQQVLKEALLKGLDDQKDILHNHGGIDQTSLREAHMKGVQTLYSIAFSMNYDTLRSLADQLLADKSDAGVMKSNLFMELLGSTGSSASALLVRDLFLEDKFDNDRDASRVLTSVPFHIRWPSKQMVEEYEKLLTFDSAGPLSKMAIPLMFGHLVRVTCERSGDYRTECFNTFASKYVNMFWDKYTSGTSREDKSMALSVLSNIRFGGVSEKLRPLVNGEMEGEANEMRFNAIVAAIHEALILHGVDYFFPIYADYSNGHDVRMVAVSMIMHSGPSSSDLTRVLAIMKEEKDYEVLNFVVTQFEQFAISINPCDKKVSKLAGFYLKYLKQFGQLEPDWNFGVSKSYTRQYYKKKFGYGGQTLHYTIGSHKSLTPMRVGIMFGATMFNSYSNTIFGIHLQLEGVAKGIIKKLKNMDPTVWKTDDLKSIFDSMNIRERLDQPIRIGITIVFKGSVVIHRLYDESSADKEGKLSGLVENLISMEGAYSINHQRIMKLGSLNYEQPNEMGFPMFAVNGLSSVLHLTATVKRGILRGLIYRDVQYDVHIFSQGSKLVGFLDAERQVRYSVIQDNIYHIHLPRKFVLGVNPSRKELKLSIERQAHDDPMYFVMHSATVVMALTKSRGKEVPDLKTHCPTCSNFVVVSKGPSAVTNRVFVERESDKGGYYVRGEYFDCELDVAKRVTVSRGIYAFSPYNKSPQTLWTSLTMGIRQINSFFTLYPKVEKCGFSFKFSQSENNPIKEIEISVRAQVEENGERMFFRGRKWLLRVYVKAKGEPAPRAWRLSISYDFTPGNIQNKFKLMINRAPVPGLNISPYTICFAYDNKYPEFSDEFLGVDFNENLETSGKAILQYGEGTECEDGDGELRVNFKHVTTREGRDDLKTKWYYKACMEDKNSPAWAGRVGGLPVTEVCWLTAWDATVARKYSWNFEFPKLTSRMSNIISKFQSLVKAGLLPYWDIDPEKIDLDGKVGSFMNIEVNFHSGDHLLDMKMETSQGVSEFKDYPLQMKWTKRLRSLKLSSSFSQLINFGIVKPCYATISGVRTMENVTYPYELDSCWTLLSGHCGSTPSYGVFIKKEPGRLPIAAKVFIGGHKVEFDVNGGSIGITINGAAINIQDKVEYEHNDSGTEIFKILRWGSTYNVYSFLKVWIVYDGNFVEIFSAPSVTGQHCGLCGNHIRNKFNDLVGKNEQPIAAAAMAEEWKWKC